MKEGEKVARKETVKAEKVKTIKEKVETLIFKPNMKLTAKEFEVLDKQVRIENEKSGVKIVLMPYSCEVVEDVE